MNRTARKCEIAEPSSAAANHTGVVLCSQNGHSPMARFETGEAREALRDYILAGSKPPEEWRCGAELELFGFDSGSLLRLDHRQIQSALSQLATDPADHADDGGIFAGAKLNIGGNLTVEPGGQLEYSTAPHRDLRKIEVEIDSYLTHLRAVARALDYRFLAIGFDPLRAIAEQHWFPKPRYDIMRPYMAGRGSRAWDMMTRTCAAQVSLDFSSAEDLLGKYALGNRLAPYVTAMFANSPFADGRVSGFKSTRAWTWLDTDPDRCGVPDLVWTDGFTVDSFVESALDIPMLFRRRNGSYLGDVTGVTFREYLDTQPEAVEIAGDWADHLTTIFTEARVKQVIELRSADSGSTAMVMALQALWKGLLYDQENLAEVTRVIPQVARDAFGDLQLAVARDGLQAESNGISVLGPAQELVRLATAGLARIAPDEVAYLDILQQQVIVDAVSPADILLRNWNGSWNGSMERVFEHVSIV